MVKQDVEALGWLLENRGRRRSYTGAMPTFTLAGVQYDYVDAKLTGDLEEIHSWEYGKWPRVEAAVPLVTGGTVNVHALASRWGHGLIRVGWKDGSGGHYSAWIPAANVRRMTASEWDIIQFHATPENLRMIQWGDRLPGFLSE